MNTSTPHKQEGGSTALNAGTGCAIGCGVGAAIGVALGELAIGLAMGAAIGALAGGLLAGKPGNTDTRDKAPKLPPEDLD